MQRISRSIVTRAAALRSFLRTELSLSLIFGVIFNRSNRGKCSSAFLSALSVQLQLNRINVFKYKETTRGAPRRMVIAQVIEPTWAFPKSGTAIWFRVDGRRRFLSGFRVSSCTAERKFYGAFVNAVLENRDFPRHDARAGGPRQLASGITCNDVTDVTTPGADATPLPCFGPGCMP